MAETKIYIVGKDRKVGAMVKVLAREPLRECWPLCFVSHSFSPSSLLTIVIYLDLLFPNN